MPTLSSQPATLSPMDIAQFMDLSKRFNPVSWENKRNLTFGGDFMGYGVRMETFGIGLGYDKNGKNLTRTVHLIVNLAKNPRDDWLTGQDDINLFVHNLPVAVEKDSPSYVYSDLKKRVFQCLSDEEILRLLDRMNHISIDVLHFDDKWKGHFDSYEVQWKRARQEWLMHACSLRAMSITHIKQVHTYTDPDTLFGIAGTSDSLQVLCSDPEKKDYFFSRIDYKQVSLLGHVQKLMDSAVMKVPAVLELIIDFLKGIINTGFMAPACHTMIFQRIGCLDKLTRSVLLRQVYTGVRKPPPETWVAAIFPHHDTQCCNDWMSEPPSFMDDRGDFIETPFCSDCNEDGGNKQPCSCTSKLKPDICDFLMEKGVSIPPRFWNLVAYYNLAFLGHYLHVNHPYGFNLQIHHGCVEKMIKFDSTGFAAFLKEYDYIDEPIRQEINRLSSSLSTSMRGMLQPMNKKRRRDHLHDCMELLDQNTKNIPEQFYIEMSSLFKRAYE